jgi:hypothetical protein
VLKEMYNKDRIVKLSNSFPTQNGEKQGDALLSLFVNFDLEYVIRVVQENQVRLELNYIYQLLAYAGYMNLFGKNTYTVMKNKETLMDAAN